MKIALIPLGLGVILLCCSWGFFAHMEINRKAVYTLPTGLLRFYKNNADYLAEHAVDPDKRRYADTAEAPRHYLDVEVYEDNIDSIPRRWDDAVGRYGLLKLNKNGILPWQIQRSYYKLVNAFKKRDSAKILIYSAYLGHYLADAHVPLHTTQNHDGQLTNQTGIHAFWESRLPELFASDYNYLVGRAEYIHDPLTRAWNIVSYSHSLVGKVLSLEAEVNASFPRHKKYSFSKRNKKLVRDYAKGYAKAYHDKLDSMVETQMRSSIVTVGSFWYAAWVDAGQPKMEGFN